MWVCVYLCVCFIIHCLYCNIEFITPTRAWFNLFLCSVWSTFTEGLGGGRWKRLELLVDPPHWQGLLHLHTYISPSLPTAPPQRLRIDCTLKVSPTDNKCFVKVHHVTFAYPSLPDPPFYIPSSARPTIRCAVKWRWRLTSAIARRIIKKKIEGKKIMSPPSYPPPDLYRIGKKKMFCVLST